MQREYGVYADLIIIYPQPYSIYLKGTIRVWGSLAAGLEKLRDHPKLHRFDTLSRAPKGIQAPFARNGWHQ